MNIIKKFNHIFDRKQKLQIILILIVILFGGIFETLGVSMILPLMSAILDKEAFLANEYVIAICDAIGVHDFNTILILIICALIFAFVFKNAYLIFSTYVQAKFVNNNRYRTSRNLLSQYLHRPYEYYLNADSATILRTIYGDMDNVFNLLQQCMNLAAETIVSFCLVCMMLVMDFKMTLVIVAMLGLTTVFISKVLKRKLNRIGEHSRMEQANQYKWILQSVSGIKDVKVLHKEKHFTKQYEIAAKNYAADIVKNNVFVNIPRLLIETVSIVSILGYLAVSILMGTSVAELMKLVSAFALAAVRLMPSVNRVNTYIANISYHESALNYIYDNIDIEAVREQGRQDALKKQEEVKESITLSKEIALSDITYAYPNTEKKIFDHADMMIPVGKSIGVVGPSGAGKTTVVDILLGLLDIQGGKITSDGTDIMKNYAGWLSHIGYIPQSIYMVDDTIRSNIAFGVKKEEIDEARVWEVLEEAQMKSFVENLPDGLDTEIGERGVRISGGQRQRLGIARALYHNPELLIFDEATSALDNDTETAIMEAIDKLHGQKTMVIIAHRLRTIENCDIIYEVKDGQIRRKEG